MALLGATSLINCLYIPGVIASGTKMIFENSTSPVSWTKDTTVSEGTLRVVNGTAASGGSITFSQAFSASKPISGSTPSSASSISGSNTPAPFTIGTVSVWPGGTTSQATALDETQMVTHSHPYAMASGSTPVSPGLPQQPNMMATPITQTPFQVFAEGGGGSHTHSVPTTPHSHSLSSSLTHTHDVNFPHSHTVSSTENFSVSYVDMIICTKD